MKKIITFLLIFIFHVHSLYSASNNFDSWANWENRLDRAFVGVTYRKVPGRCMGFIVPSDPREDLLPLSAFAYESMLAQKNSTFIILMEPPKDYELEGIVFPGIDLIETTFGTFPIDSFIRSLWQSDVYPIRQDPTLFSSDIPQILLNQLAFLKYRLNPSALKLKVLPGYVNFSDINSQSKDYAPFLANALKDAGLDKNVVVILVSNFSYSSIMQDLVKNDSQALSSLQNIETDRFLYSREEFMTQNITLPNPSILGFGVLLFKCLAADHAEVLGYAVSSQLYLSKDKSTHTSFVTAAFSSEPRIHTVPSHVTQEKILEKFDELFRGDILTMTRQAIASMLDPTAAYPPALNSKEAGKKWPLYVTLYDPDGNIAGEAGSHVAIGPLEESIRKFAFEAVRQAKPALSKINFSNYVIEVSIPYGFHKVRSPEDLTPLLHGVIVSQKLKSVATHPNAWRTTSNPHQLLGSLCAQLGLNPWAYTTGEAALTSFRVLSFNEKEPFQDLGGGSKKKKRKKVTADDLANEEDENTGGGGGGGGSPFSF